MKKFQLGFERYKELADAGDIAAQKKLGKLLAENGLRYLQDSVLSGDAEALEILSAITESAKQLLHKGRRVQSTVLSAGGQEFFELAVGKEFSLGINPLDRNPILWEVLDVQDGKALILSKYFLTHGAFHDKWGLVTWEGSSLRRYLNTEFLAEAFSDDEKYNIVTSLVKAHENPMCNTEPGMDTKDKVFLLSVVEVEKYFPAPMERKCFDAQADKNGRQQVGWWWLRTPGFNEANAATVCEDGTFSYSYTREVKGGIRPAMWITL